MNAGPFEISQVILGENLEELAKLPDGSFQMIYIDPPFNTGRDQFRRQAIPDRVAPEVLVPRQLR